MFRGSTDDKGDDFDQFVADWDGEILTPFNQFLQKVYRASYAIFPAF
jgi:hypothetical protein